MENTITVITHRTADRYEREYTFSTANRRTAAERFAEWVTLHSHRDGGVATPYEATNGQCGVVYLLPH